MGHRNTVNRLTAAAVLILTATFHAHARADIPDVSFRPGLADYDQRWDRPGQNNGANHCVPTTYLNLLFFMHNKGMTQLGAWAPAENDSNEIRHRVFLLGDEDHLDTDPDSGTDAEDAFYYMVDFIADRSGDALLFHMFYGPDFDWGTGTLANLHNAGAIMAIGYGRYYHTDWLYGSYWYRDGGHYMAFGGYSYLPDQTKYLFTRNPARGDDDLDRQSAFRFDTQATNNITFTTWDGVRKHARYSFDTGPNGDRRCIIDKMHVILPAYGGWNNLSGSNAAARNQAAGLDKPKSEPAVTVIMPWQFEGVDTPREFSFIPRERLVDWTFDAGELATYYVTHLGRIFRVDLLTGEQKLVHVLKGAKSLMVGGSTADLYVLGEDTQGSHNQPWIAQVDRDTNLVKVRPLPTGGAALEYDPISAGPAVLANSLDKMIVLDDELIREAVVALPAVPPGAGQVLFKIAGDGSVYVGRAGDGSVRVLNRLADPRTGDGSVRTLNLAARSGIVSLNPVDKNTLIVQDGTTLQTYTPAGELKRSQFSGIAVNGEFKMARTHFAARHGSMRGPAWRDLRPDEVIDSLP